VSDLERAARQRADYATELLERLIAEPSVEGSEAIERCLDHVAAELAPLARELLRPEHHGLSALIARFGPASSSPVLAFSGHVDVVPAEGDWTSTPFELARDAHLLRGRGVCDMKGGVAAFTAAIHALSDADLLPECSLELVLTGDEEVGSRRGLIPLLDEGLVKARSALCGEPTGLDLFLGNRGLLWIEVKIRGRGGHAGMSHALASPIGPAVELARELARLPLEARDERFDPSSPSLTVTKLEAGGDALNIVPDEAVLALDRRLNPGEDVEAATRQIVEAIERTITPPFESDVAVIREWPPYAISGEEEIARVSRAAVREVGRPAKIGMDLASNDSSWLDRAGIATVLLGPGDPAQAHTTDEELSADQLRDAVVIYAQTAARMGGRRAAAGESAEL
jgi:acetylornithine deacetylase/succinyl-diaminopimelate desuccinylase-like protein